MQNLLSVIFCEQHTIKNVISAALLGSLLSVHPILWVYSNFFEPMHGELVNIENTENNFLGGDEL